LLIDAARRNNRIVQHGTQVRSTPTIMQGVKALQDGIIGDVLVAKAWNVQMRNNIGHQSPSEPPSGLNYEEWVGPVSMVPFQGNCYGQWHYWQNFGTGDMGNDGVHDIDYCRWGLGVDTHPTKISSEGGKFFFDDDQEHPDTQQVTYEYPGDGQPGDRRLLIYEQRLWSTNYPHNVDSGAEFYGTSGQLFLSRRGKIELLNDRNQKTEIKVSPKAQDDAAHVKNLCDAIREGAKLNADALTGHVTTTLCHLGNISTRLGRSLTFDPQTEQIVGDDEANALVRREYREHWGTPQGA
jgi:predicted dehydrogenase